jgi:hypothetical protein
VTTQGAGPVVGQDDQAVWAHSCGLETRRSDASFPEVGRQPGYATFHVQHVAVPTESRERR